MKTVWQQDGETRSVTAPLSLIVSAFAPVPDVRNALTPVLQPEASGGGGSDLWLVDLGLGQQRLGASALAQVYAQVGATTPDLDEPRALVDFFAVLQSLSSDGRVLAYHDRSDGGLFVTLCEMAFAGACGFEIALDSLGPNVLETLFCEELGAVFQTRRGARQAVYEAFEGAPALAGHLHRLGHVNWGDDLRFTHDGRGGAGRIEATLALRVVGDQLPDAGDARRTRMRPRGIRPHRGPERARAAGGSVIRSGRFGRAWGVGDTRSYGVGQTAGRDPP